jgi:23S rRNA (guanosine2251-2'-O)-methyltransferase
MAGNSKRRGAIRKEGTKKGPQVGSGGVRRRGLEGRGATPPAYMRPGHPAARKAATKARKAVGRPAGKPTDETEMVLGRNPVLECLRAHAPASALYVALGTEADERLTESVTMAADRGIPILEVPRIDLDRMSSNGLHQGIALQVPPYAYLHPDDLLAAATSDVQPALLVALDNISDPRNLGAIIRSVAAFGGQGVIVPQRRSVGLTASAWKTSAGAAARTPVAMAANLTQTIKAFKEHGVFVIGLDGGGTVQLPELALAREPVLVVVGSEGKGLSRLVTENCDAVVSIPISSGTESLNAGIAASVTLYEISKLRAAAKK